MNHPFVVGMLIGVMIGLLFSAFVDIVEIRANRKERAKIKEQLEYQPSEDTSGG
jgi:uncharacterized integral membrane protein